MHQALLYRLCMQLTLKQNLEFSVLVQTGMTFWTKAYIPIPNWSQTLSVGLELILWR